MNSLRNEIEKNKKKDTRDAFWIVLVLGIAFWVGAVLYSVNNIIKIGISIKYFQPTILNAGVLFILALTFSILSYYIYKEKNK